MPNGLCYQVNSLTIGNITYIMEHGRKQEEVQMPHLPGSEKHPRQTKLVVMLIQTQSFE